MYRKSLLYHIIIDNQKKLIETEAKLEKFKSGYFDLVFSYIHAETRKYEDIFSIYSDGVYNSETEEGHHWDNEEVRNGVILWFENEIALIKNSIVENEKELLEYLKNEYENAGEKDDQ